MNYILKEGRTLTNEYLTNSYWKVNKEQFEFLKGIGKNMGFLWDDNNREGNYIHFGKYAFWSVLDYFDKRDKLIKFDNWFEEDDEWDEPSVGLRTIKRYVDPKAIVKVDGDKVEMQMIPREGTFNEYYDYGDYLGMLFRNKEGFLFAESLIDREDYEKVSKIKWHLNSNGYVRNKIKGYLHQFLIGKEEGKVTDHQDRNKLNNRKENLRIVTQSENMYNRDSKGVIWAKDRNKWRTWITVEDKRKYIGQFDNYNEAVLYRKNFVKNLGEKQ